MPTLLLRLVGPMQSWGTTSRFDQRDTGKEPSKSGIIGLLAAARGIDRENWTDLKPLTRLNMGVRHDRPGIPKCDYQTAGCATTDTIIKADGNQSKDGIVFNVSILPTRLFLSDLNATNDPFWKRFTLHCAIQSGLWLWGANPMYPLNRSGSRMAFKMLRCEML